MFALNFQSQNHEKLLISRQKNCTVRLGDISDKYPENSIVWITVGTKYKPKRKLYSAILDRVQIKKIAELTSHDLDHQNPEIKSVDELISFFEKIYQRTITHDDIVTVIYFSEIVDE
ncbi:ASCH domain-containing protein [Dendrosporobacter sp. 1207_IL3150]|uniref:ASCH domain-containing protein n=1 Tax=Dendrosporobacter sp. 1207_IL3150 TaxID=3084054 RepID=UPI002FD9B489